MTNQEKLDLGTLGEEWSKKLGYKARGPGRYVQLLQIVRKLGGFIYVTSPMAQIENDLPHAEVIGPNNFAIAIWDHDMIGESGQLADIARLLYFYLVVSKEGQEPLLRQKWGVPYDEHTYACEQFAAGFLIPYGLVPTTFPKGQPATKAWQYEETWHLAKVSLKVAEMRVDQLYPN